MKNSHQNYSPGNKQGNYSNYNNPDNFSKKKTGGHNGTSSTDTGSRGTDTIPDGLSVTSSSSTTEETRT